jgi:hypothetical protein
MNIFHDKMIARRMLRAREHGYTFGHFLRTNSKRYLLMLCFDIIFIGYWAYFQIWIGFYIAIGLVVGSHTRDISWFISHRRTWPFTVKTTDWQKVESLSKDKPSV